MTEPTDAELIALLGDRQFSSIGAVREALRRWGTPPAVAGEPVGEVESSLRFTGGFHVRLYRDAHIPEPGTKLYTTPQPTQAQAVAVLTDREIELIDGMIQIHLDHASRCDAIPNRPMADKQKGWDMERVALLQKLKFHGIKGGQHGADT